MTNSWFPAHGRVLGCIAALVAALVVVPAVVRATQQIDGRSKTSSVRLNRGFSSPVAKIKLTPPDRGLSTHVVAIGGEPPFPEAIAGVAPDGWTPDSLPYRLETRRGPPAPRLVQ